MLNNIRALLEHGVQMYSDYSGIDGQREGFERQLKHLLQARPEWQMNFYDQVQHVRTCDIGDLQTSVNVSRHKKLNTSKRGPQECHFKDIRDRLPEAAYKYLMAALPNYKTDTKEARQEAIHEIKEWLKLNQGWVFGDMQQTSYCHVHRCECPVHPAFNPAWKEVAATSDPLFICTAGICCQGYSREGLNEQEGHISESALLVHMVERCVRMQQLLEDVCFWECAVSFPGKAKVLDIFKDDPVMLVEITDGPHLHGDPVRRLRWRAALINLRRLKWTGPKDHDSLQDAYNKMFHRFSVLDGDSYMIDTDENYFKESALMARRQGFEVSASELSKWSEPDLLMSQMAAGAYQRYKKFKVLAEKRGGTVLFDCDHNPGFGLSYGSDFPTMMTHGQIWKITESRGPPRRATAMEHLQAQGFNVLDKSHDITEWADILGQFSARQIKLLAGNGQHCKVEGAFIFFILGHLQRMDSHCADQLPRTQPDTAVPDVPACSAGVPARGVPDSQSMDG